MEYRPRYRPTSRPTLGRDIDRHVGEISTDTWSSVGRNALQVGRASVATIGRYVVGMSVYTRPTPRPIYSTDISADTRPTIDRYLARESTEMSADSVGRVSVECRSSIGRHINRHTPPTYSTDIFHRHSRPTSWPTLGREIDRHLVEHRSTCSSSW